MRVFSRLALALTLSAVASAQTPTIAPNGVIHGATLTRSGIAPGSILTIFGENLADTSTTAASLPWPTTLGNVSVTIDNLPAAILYVSPRQVNVQASWSLLESSQTARTARVIVTRASTASAPVTLDVTAMAPGVFTVSSAGIGMAIALNGDDASMAQPTGTVAGRMARPARIGSTVSVYATGLGRVTPSAVTGQASLDLFRRTATTPEVLIGGRVARVLYSGLAAAAPGVNQLNVVIPDGVTAGMAVPVQIRVGGMATTDRVTIAVDSSRAPETALPGANAENLWSFLNRENFRQNYTLLAGKTQLYPGIPPHSQLLTVYLNPIARDAVQRKSGMMPQGSLVIKEAHGPDRALASSLLMYKVQGFDPPNSDWFYSTRRADGAIGASGSIQGCFGCHSRSKTNDFLFLTSPVAAPAPNATAVRDYLASQNYRETWRLWPGTTEMQPAAEPHGAMVTIYVNEPAYDAIQNKPGTMPDGAVIVKENYMPDRSLAALTVMLKAPGFNPTAGNWYWLQQLPNGTAAAEGRAQGCISCHATVATNDYLYTGSVETLPQPRAAAVWDYVQKQQYQTKWKLWPGTTALTPGNMPHGALLSTYVNDIAYEAIMRKRGVMPPGGVVVKENYMPDRTLAAVTLMYKSEGFDPDHNDWYWLQRLANGTVAAEGRVSGCISCHSAAAANDYLYLGPLR